MSVAKESLRKRSTSKGSPSPAGCSSAPDQETAPFFLSVVVPVYNEEANIEALFTRLCATLDRLGRSYEIIFVNDGSKDRTAGLLEQFYEQRPHQIQVVEFNGNYGQHMAIMAGFERVRGTYALTIDADLQNPPEEIPKLLTLIDAGHDYVGSYRIGRKDTWFRTYASHLVNWIRGKVTPVHMREHGCMLRAYHRRIVKAVTSSRESSTLVPVLAYTYAADFAEVGIAHCAREGDESKYNLYKLIRMKFDLFTGFSLVPLQLFTLLGLGVSGLSSLLVLYMIARRIFLGSEAQGTFTLFAIVFFLISFAITGIGLLGEYVGRTYQLVCGRPRFLIRRTLGGDET